MNIDSEKFAPVISWSSVRLFVLISLKPGWQMVPTEWDNAFVQTSIILSIRKQ